MLYPKTGCAGDAHYEISRILGFDYGKQPAPEAQRSAFLAHLKTEVKKSGCETCIISSENFVLPKNVKLVGDLFADFSCKIVVYLRRHDHWWYSAYSQAVKMVVHPPWVPGFKGFLEFNRQKNPQFGNYRALLDRWAKVFGQENIIVRPYEKEQNQPTIIADFLTTIGVADCYSIFSDSKMPHVNRSLDARRIFLLETFQRMNVNENVRRLLIDNVLIDAGTENSGTVISPADRRQLVEEAASQYKYIAQTYLNRPDGVLFFEPLPDPQAAWKAPQRPTIVEVADVVARVLSNRE